MQADVNSGVPAALAPKQLGQLFGLITGYHVSQALRAVVTLGIPDRLAHGPRTSDDLARETETHAGALYRVLRFLTGAGLFEEVAPRTFGLTALGAGLRSDVPGTLHTTTLMLLDPANWQAWGEVLHSLRTGTSAFEHVHGQEIFAYLRAHPTTARIFNEAMTESTALSDTAITRAYDFTGVERLVDVGGGQGLLLATILQAYPAMRGVLFDQPQVVADARATLEAAGVAERCEVVDGDFFASVPSGGDAYLLRQILHDWDDTDATAILASCRRAMPGTGRVLVLESVIVPDYRQALPILHLDLDMLILVGGMQRTEAEYRALFDAAGLRLQRVLPLGDVAQFSVFEGVPV